MNNGWEKLDKSFLVAGANKGLSFNENPDIEWVPIPIQCYLIEHEDGYILFDTGCDPEFKKTNGLVMIRVVEYWQWIIKGIVFLFAVAMSQLNEYRINA